jgi:hypothetical protein
MPPDPNRYERILTVHVFSRFGEFVVGAYGSKNVVMETLSQVTEACKGIIVSNACIVLIIIYHRFIADMRGQMNPLDRQR